MILAEKQGSVRTPIEQMLLNEMNEEDMQDIIQESDIAAVIDDASTDTGLFSNTMSGDDMEHLLDDADLEDCESLF